MTVPLDVLTRLPEPAKRKLLLLDALWTDADISAAQAQTRLNSVGRFGDETIAARYLAAIQAQQHRRGELWDLIGSITRWVRSLSPQAPIEPVATPPPALKDGESVEIALARLRAEIGEALVERMQVSQAPEPKAELKRRMRAYVAELVLRGAPRLRTERGKPFEVLFTDRMQDFGNSPEFIASTLAWLAPAQFAERLETMIDGLRDDNAMSDAAQAKALADLDAELDQLQRDEEALIMSAFESGVDLLRRGAALPAAVLSVKVPQAKLTTTATRKPRPIVRQPEAPPVPEGPPRARSAAEIAAAESSAPAAAE